jgi:transposase InsO family protein
MTAQLVTDALVMAIWRRGRPDALLHHSDRVAQDRTNSTKLHRTRDEAKADVSITSNVSIIQSAGTRRLDT